jgi:hypothetical protein
VATLDVTGDGKDDVLIGAPLADGNGYTDDGAFYLLYGNGTILTSYTVNAFLRGGQSNSRYGYSVAGGDFNGDGYDDVLVGAKFYDNGQLDEGLAFVYNGSSTGLRAQLASRMQSNEHHAFLGGSVANAGDTNGDGYDDAIIGAVGSDAGGIDRGCAWVYLGSSTGLHEPTEANSFCSTQNNSLFGAAVASAGDVNADGYADVLIGAPGYDGSLPDAGLALLYLGSASGPTAPGPWVSSPPYHYFNYGRALASAGDVNGDGKDDVLVDARTNNSGVSIGEGDLYLYLANSP